MFVPPLFRASAMSAPISMAALDPVLPAPDMAEALDDHSRPRLFSLALLLQQQTLALISATVSVAKIPSVVVAGPSIITLAVVSDHS